ncbi:MAG: DsrE family protein [Gammaproteobacteria bacterium]|nr:DsrE family protein [Gammaproteobacteria bacterium]
MAASKTLGCLVRSAPYAERSGRDALDLVMAALLDGWHLELFFIGDGALHLVGAKQPSSAGLPGTWKGWKSLPELGPVRAWVEASDAVPGSLDTHDSLLPCRETNAGDMAKRLTACDRVVML